MFSSVETADTHYQTLGLTPAATGDEIAKAFVSRIQIDVTSPEEADQHADKVFAAYETLRDPLRRRIYDASLGLGLESEPQQPDVPSQPETAPFIGVRSDEPASPDPTSEPRPEAPAEQRVAPFIAAALRDPVDRGDPETPAAREPQSEPEFPPEATDERRDPPVAGYSVLHDWKDANTSPTARPRSSDWNRAGVGAGAVVLGLGVLTLLTGLWWGNVERAPNDARGPITASAKPSGTGPNTIAAQPIAPFESGAFPLQSDDSSVAVPVEMKLAVPNPTDQPFLTISTPGDPPPENAAVDATPPAAEPKVAGTTSSANPAVALPNEASTASTDPLAPLPPAPSAQSRPTTVAQAAVASTASIPPPPLVNRSAPAKWLSGGLVQGDNAGGWFKGTVGVRFTVQPNGRVTGCRPSASSGNRDLDTRTCRLIEQRLRFSPALDSQGRAVASEAQATYSWGKKHRPLLKGLWGLIQR